MASGRRRVRHPGKNADGTGVGDDEPEEALEFEIRLPARSIRVERNPSWAECASGMLYFGFSGRTSHFNAMFTRLRTIAPQKAAPKVSTRKPGTMAEASLIITALMMSQNRPSVTIV